MQRFQNIRLTPYLFLAPATIVLALALLYPIAYAIYGSFFQWRANQHISDAEFVGWQNYITLLNDPAFAESFWVTIVFATTVVGIEMVIGVGLALLLDRKIRGMSTLRTIFILPMMIAPIVVGMVWKYMYHEDIGVFNEILRAIGFEDGVPWLSEGDWAFASIIIADIWQWTPFVFILSLAALQSLPRSALEAARLDGASGWQQAIYIKIPLMMPVLIVTALLRLIDAFKVLEVILVLTNGGPGLSTEILSLRIMKTASEFQELGLAAALANFLLLLLLALTLGMFAYTKLVEARAARLRRRLQEEG